jgi:NADPH2:quinone reductase
MKAIRLHEFGDAGNMHWEEVAMPTAKAGEVLIKNKAVGVNFIDIYYRTGLYTPPQMPTGLGIEGCGEVVEVGEGCENFFSIGEKVGYVGCPLGAYAEYHIVPWDKVIKVPDTISEAHIAGLMLKGLTARFLVKYSYAVNPDAVVVIHAAAGGVGLLLSQWAKHLGGIIIGTVGSDEKAQLALANGCDYVINYRTQDVAATVMEITEGKGAGVVYDSVGRDTFESSIASLGDCGILVSYGQASGPVPPFDLGILRPKSLFLNRPQLFTFIKSRNDMVEGSIELFDMVLKGNLKLNIMQTYYLQDAASAHRDLELRKNLGSTVLIVE